MAVDRKGSRLLIANFRPRRPAGEAAAELAPDVKVDDVPAYVMVSCSTAPGTVVPPAAEWTARDAAGAAGVDARGRIEGWHPAARAIVAGHGAGLDVHDPVRLPRAAEESWEPIARDASSATRPTACCRRSAWAPTSRSTTPRCSSTSWTGTAAARPSCSRRIGAYEAQMRELAYPILRMTLDHDKNFGGGGLQRGRRADGASRRRVVTGRLAGKVASRHRHRRRHRPGHRGAVRPRGRPRRRLRPATPGPSQETVDLVRAAGGRMDAVAPVDLSTEDGARALGRRGGRARPAASTSWSTTPRRSGSARSTSCPTPTGRSPSATSSTSCSW